MIPKPLSQGVTMFKIIIRLVEQFKFPIMRFHCSKMTKSPRCQKWPFMIKNDLLYAGRPKNSIEKAQKLTNFTKNDQIEKNPFWITNISTLFSASKFWSSNNTTKTSNSWSESCWTNIWTAWLFKRIDWNNKKDEKSKRDSRSDVIGDSAI